MKYWGVNIHVFYFNLLFSPVRPWINVSWWPLSSEGKSMDGVQGLFNTCVERLKEESTWINFLMNIRDTC